MNSDCNMLVGPCTCGAWHSQEESKGRMTLGELEFKAEDFEEKVEYAYRTRAAKQLAQIITNEANRLLHEKLEKAPKCWGARSALMGMIFRTVIREKSHDTHTARLVCIEEIKK